MINNLNLNTMLTAKTPISGLSKYKVRKIAALVVDFCSINLGKCRNKQFPMTYVSYSNSEEFIGEYDPFNHEILVYAKNCPTVMELVKTIVHEWTHSKQRVKSDYQRLHRKFGYRDNPLEIEAFASEKIWGRKALNYVKKSLKK